jgi:hypothetical protein
VYKHIILNKIYFYLLVKMTIATLTNSQGTTILISEQDLNVQLPFYNIASMNEDSSLYEFTITLFPGYAVRINNGFNYSYLNEILPINTPVAPDIPPFTLINHFVISKVVAHIRDDFNSTWHCITSDLLGSNLTLTDIIGVGLSLPFNAPDIFVEPGYQLVISGDIGSSTTYVSGNYNDITLPANALFTASVATAPSSVSWKRSKINLYDFDTKSLHFHIDVTTSTTQFDFPTNLNFTDGTTNILDVIDYLERVVNVEADIDLLEGRTSVNEAEVDLLEGRMSTAEDDIDALEGRTSINEADLLVLMNRANSNASRLQVDDSELSALEAYVDALEGRMSVTEDDIELLEGRTSVNEFDIEALNVRTDGNDMPATATTFGNLPGTGKWMGGVVTSDGKIYGIPYSSSTVIEFDPVTQNTIQFGNLPGIAKWTDGVLAPNGKIYGIPYDSTTVLEFDPVTQNITLFGNLPGTRKWWGGVLASNGKIYGIPLDSDKVLEIDPITRDITLFGDDLSLGNSKWAGGVLAPNGKIYASPFTSSKILEIDPV